MPNGRHIYSKASDIVKATMCTYNQSDHALTHWKCALRCYGDCTCINLTDQETNKKHEEITPSIRFHIYHIIARCIAHGKISLKYNKRCYICKQ